MLLLHKETHLDHGLTSAQVDHVVRRFADRTSFFLETVDMPPELGTVPCSLVGPAMGDEPVAESEVEYKVRGERTWASRIVHRPSRTTSRVTVIAGPHVEECANCTPVEVRTGDDPRPPCVHCGDKRKLSYACIVYTMYGGVPAPQEAGDPACKDPDASAKFWSEHALVCQDLPSNSRKSDVHQDSTGKKIFVGDRVRWRGRDYTIKAFKTERDPVFGAPLLEFEEPLHLTEQPNETSVDLL